MRFLLTTLLLSALFAFSIAKPVPASSLDEIERRWSEGESEVRQCQPSLEACYIMAWIRSLASATRRASIHATHNYRDATPAWPVVRDALEFSWDERTAEMRHQKRADGERTLMQKMKKFVNELYRKKGKKSPVAGRQRLQEREEEAPVLKPRKAYRYHWAA